MAFLLLTTRDAGYGTLALTGRVPLLATPETGAAVIHCGFAIYSKVSSFPAFKALGLSSFEKFYFSNSPIYANLARR